MMPTGKKFRKNDAWFQTIQLTFDCNRAAEDDKNEKEEDRARMKEVVSIKEWYTSLKTKMVVLIRDLAIDFACPPLESKETSNQKHQRLYAAYRGWEAIHDLHASQENSDSDSDGSYGSYGGGGGGGGEEDASSLAAAVVAVVEEEVEVEEEEVEEDVNEDVNEDDVTDNFVKKMEIIATQLEDTNPELANTMRLEIYSFNQRRTQRSKGSGGGGGGSSGSGGGGADALSKFFVALRF